MQTKEPRWCKLILNAKNGCISVDISYFQMYIPLFILFRALGAVSDKEIVELIFDAPAETVDPLLLNMLRPSIHETGYVYNQQMALKFMKMLIKKMQILQTVMAFITRIYFLTRT